MIFIFMFEHLYTVFSPILDLNVMCERNYFCKTESLTLVMNYLLAKHLNKALWYFLY